MFIGHYQSSDKNEFYRMLLLDQSINADLNLSEERTESSIDVRHLFPFWILQRSEIDVPENYLVKFTQAYYDWLYNFSDYELNKTSYDTIGLRRLLDINTTPVEFLKHFTYTYASGFPDYYFDREGITFGGNIECFKDVNSNIRTFIKNVRQSFYQRKSSEDAYRYFFSSLFGVSGSEVEFFYPKADILRLNGGRFGNKWKISHEGFTGNFFGEKLTGIEEDDPTWHLGGSYLNGRYRLQDSDWYQEYSYVLKTGIDCVNEETGLPIYFDNIYEMLHPAGMKAFWERTESDYIPPEDDSGGFNLCEVPRLENYFPYRLGDRESINLCVGCSGSGFTYSGPTGMFYSINPNLLGGMTGWTYGYGWTGVGCGGLSAEFNAPTHNYPDWATGISGSPEHRIPFGNIYIGDFIYLCPLKDSPNLGITGCTANSDTNAGPCWPV